MPAARRTRARALAARAAKLAVLTALLAVLAALVIAAATGSRCFLDVLNGAIRRQCAFEPFYAGVPGTPPPRAVVPELGPLEDAYPRIRAEMEAVLRDRDRIPQMRDVYDNIFLYKGSGARGPPGRVARALTRLVYGPDTEIFDRIGSPGWKTFNLVLFGRDVPRNAARCPATVALLRRVPGMQSALFSILAPGAYIPPHNDPAKGVVRYHLALRVPRDRANCFISVAGREYCWAEGRGVLFDDAFDHWVWNDTDEERVILFVDIQRPLRGAARALQGLANLANRYHPGVRRAIRESAVRPGAFEGGAAPTATATAMAPPRVCARCGLAPELFPDEASRVEYEHMSRICPLCWAVELAQPDMGADERRAAVARIALYGLRPNAEFGRECLGDEEAAPPRRLYCIGCGAEVAPAARAAHGALSCAGAAGPK